ncbi:hypothetical protein [Nocardia sp. AG03]|uniref:hypothetical protein n=1 Tax=Nocardia sp. AG03 TaxID=3025312 RepID=UPI0024188F36|nr:hypothetical protein [Nocardia sp. AG03]
MSAPTDPAARARGAAVGAAAGAVAILAHGLGGASTAPSGAAITLLLAACALIGVVAAALPRPTGALATMALLTVGQAVGHLALSLGHTHHHTFTAAMLLAHALAVPVCALAIRAAEVGARRAITSVRRLIRVLTEPPATSTSPPRPPLSDERATVRRLLLRPGIGLRAPPTLGRTMPQPGPA